MGTKARCHVLDTRVYAVSLVHQRLFNKVARHLLKQGVRAANGELMTCQYRTSDGKRCAVGCLISDRYYKPGMEGWDVIGLIDEGFNLPSSIIENGRFLADLQDIHDGYDPGVWPDRLREFAIERDLKLDALS